MQRVISVDVPQYDSQFAAAKKSNYQLLNRVLGGVTHTLRHVSDPLDLLGTFKAKEYSAIAYYSGPFRIADTMTIKVKVSRATSALPRSRTAISQHVFCWSQLHIAAHKKQQQLCAGVKTDRRTPLSRHSWAFDTPASMVYLKSLCP